VINYTQLEGQTSTKQQAKGQQDKNGGDKPTRSADGIVPPGLNFSSEKNPEAFHRDYG
jgi:hypothetical protein